jgi:hypothetical protein
MSRRRQITLMLILGFVLALTLLNVSGVLPSCTTLRTVPQKDLPMVCVAWHHKIIGRGVGPYLVWLGSGGTPRD